MNEDNVKGKFEDVKGRAKRQVGEWTGDENAQAEGAMDQVKGKTQDAYGKVKEGAENLKDDVKDAFNKDRDRKDENAA